MTSPLPAHPSAIVHGIDHHSTSFAKLPAVGLDHHLIASTAPPPPSTNSQTRKAVNPQTRKPTRHLVRSPRTLAPSPQQPACSALQRLQRTLWQLEQWPSGTVEQWSGAPTRHHLDSHLGSHPLGHPLGRPIFHVLTPTHAPPLFLTCITLHPTTSHPVDAPVVGPVVIPKNPKRKTFRRPPKNARARPRFKVKAKATHAKGQDSRDRTPATPHAPSHASHASHAWHAPSLSPLSSSPSRL
ncbi:hypothetical protein BKA56DRAFT_610663 [Ilyonectria sp. MPI-CAGE-AT-0026]|nr:hypothetical protein BKA56DRAFT_610663 [Ilyonectria sp. MPI-CAGE-AT-0026]